MTADNFAMQLKQLTPDIHKLSNMGLTKMTIERLVAGYRCVKLKNEKFYEDELLNLVNNYDLSSVEIGIITFNSSIIESDDYYYIGKVEADILVVNKITKEVQVLEFDAPSNILWNCAADGSKVLDSLIVCTAFMNRCTFDNKLWNNNKIILETSLECADLAGGIRYIDFYKMLLNYFD